MSDGIIIRIPDKADGAAMWRVARDAQTLDLNSPYFYVMFATLFASRSAVAVCEGRVQGFMAGLTPPGKDSTLFVWQVAVDTALRGKGVGARLIEFACRQMGARFLETTVTPNNYASRRLFSSLAGRWGVTMNERAFISAAEFPQGLPHEAEPLITIGPMVSFTEPGAAAARQGDDR